MEAVRHLYDTRAASAASVDPTRPSRDRVQQALLDIVQPSDYVKWEYLSRQTLLAGAVLASGRRPLTRILDVGCGYGALSLSLSEVDRFDIVGMDLLRARLESVRAKMSGRRATGNRVHLVAADAHRLPFRNATFDAVVATEVLEHLDEPDQLFREAHRVLRSGGRFLMTTPNAKALPYRVLRFLPERAVRKLAASCTQESLHPELLHHHASSGTDSDPDRHRREGFTLPEIRTAAVRVGLRMAIGYTYRIPLPDRIMAITPRVLSRPIATWGTRSLPMGLQLFAEFEKP
jgi:ubiquinone/menaquinone biosynthesis C-methylase UbiE